ncbi:MAG: LLM class F420-dependent oxidoreductase [Candidatus Binataceae bacterium]|jgi:probable F420-dependent oxidoreductase
MKIGLMHVTPYSKADPAIIAKRAEELGFESYWVGDHTIVPVTSSMEYPGAKEDGREPDYVWQLPDPLIALARAGATTSRIKLGTGILLVPEHNPILTAKQVATLDDGCGGRFLFGIGGGWNPEESTILGGDFEHRWSQVKDYIAAMKVLWRDHNSEYHGRYVDFPAVRCFPKPMSKPHPPILIGSINNPRALKRVAEWGDGWIPVVKSVEEFADGVRRIKAMAKDYGRDPDKLDFSVFGVEGQWRTADEIGKLKRVGAHRVVIFLIAHELDSILREMENLAGTVLV